MIDLTDRDYIAGLKSNMRASLESEAGKQVMEFLEAICGWYDFNETDPDSILIAHGKRQVLAEIKTIMKLTPDQIVGLLNSK